MLQICGMTLRDYQNCTCMRHQNMVRRKQNTEKSSKMDSDHSMLHRLWRMEPYHIKFKCWIVQYVTHRHRQFPCFSVHLGFEITANCGPSNIRLTQLHFAEFKALTPARKTDFMFGVYNGWGSHFFDLRMDPPSEAWKTKNDLTQWQRPFWRYQVTEISFPRQDGWNGSCELWPRCVAYSSFPDQYALKFLFVVFCPFSFFLFFFSINDQCRHGSLAFGVRWIANMELWRVQSIDSTKFSVS